MIKNVLKTNKLTKSYNNIYAINDVSISLKEGRIYGLIGRNGAGKTTLMRLVAGLSFPTKGDIELFGYTGRKALEVERKRLGCLIEYPSVVGNMTAKENLKLHRIIRGIPNQEIEDEMLNFVGLGEVGKKKAKDFSLGMKQRLGIAIALLNNPELLILDEPTNGLDPLGVADIRRLLKKLCEEKNMTILISSHNLPELYQTATDYIILDKGEVKKILTLSELEECCNQHILISCEQPELLASVLETKLNTTNYKVMPNKDIKLYDYLDSKETVSKVLIENNIVVTKFKDEGDTLEDFFISIVGGASNV
ncbi:ABC transporter ATP-binding protein [Clostridiaceae bacterium M8S5]|nr:ABC transporter ATP-binding protein [Clostridiaceae bacterium M8S5]